MKRLFWYFQIFVLAFSLPNSFAALPDTLIQSVYPVINALDVPENATIFAQFETSEINPATVNSSTVKVHGSFTGYLQCNIFWNSSQKRLYADPVRNFKSGERILVSLTSGIRTMSGTEIDPVTWNFTVASSGGSMQFSKFSSADAGNTEISSVITGDIDLDGDIDIALLMTNSNEIVLLKNNGSGTLSIFGNTIVQPPGTRFIVMADFDSDGDLDLASGTTVFTMSVFMNDGSGIFIHHATYPNLGGAFMTYADSFGDGDIDLVGGIRPEIGVGWNIASENDGSGNFSLRHLCLSSCACCVINSNHQYFALLSGDYNNDGRNDLIVSGMMMDLVSACYCEYSDLYCGNDMEYDFAISLPSLSQHSPTLNANDLDGNGFIDIIKSPAGILLNDSMAFAVSSFPGTGGLYATGDLDGDGDIDIAEKSDISRKLKFLRNNGSSDFQLFKERNSMLTSGQFAIADLDGDGDLDIVSSNCEPGIVSVFKNDDCTAQTCNLAGPRIVPPKAITQYTSSVGVGEWSVLNYGGSNAKLHTPHANDTVSLNTGEYSGVAELSYKYTDNCGSHVENILITIESPLPVELISFTGAFVNDAVHLKWSASDEINNAGFDVEVKDNLNGSWHKFGFVEAKGSSAGVNEYEYVDNEPASGTLYYRLRQIDFGGNFRYYELADAIFVNEPENYNLLQNYPNPFNSSTIVRYSIPEYGRVTITLYDVIARVVSVPVDEPKSPGRYSAKIELSGLSSGIYFYELKTAHFRGVKRMMLIR